MKHNHDITEESIRNEIEAISKRIDSIIEVIKNVLPEGEENRKIDGNTEKNMPAKLDSDQEE